MQRYLYRLENGKIVLIVFLFLRIISLNRFSREQAHARAHGPFTNVTLYNCFRPHSRPEVPFHSWIGHNGGFTRLLRTPASRHAPAASPSPPRSHSLPPLSFPYLSLFFFPLSLLPSRIRPLHAPPFSLSPVHPSFSLLFRTRARTPRSSSTVQFFPSLSRSHSCFIALSSSTVLPYASHPL